MPLGLAVVETCIVPGVILQERVGWARPRDRERSPHSLD